MYSKHNKQGFTLIELLVVVSIIAVLLSVVFVVINEARQKSRDAKRVSDITEINKAIVLYQLDNNGSSPDLGVPACADINNYLASCFASSGQGLANWNILLAQLSPYINILISDPCPTCTAFDNFLPTAYANNFDFEYVYHAPAAVRAYIIANNLNISLNELAANPYSIYAKNLENKEGSFGIGLSVPKLSTNNGGGGDIAVGGEDPVDTEDPIPNCVYSPNTDLCNLWSSCNSGNQDDCFKLVSSTETCPFSKQEEEERLCGLWFSCYIDQDADSCNSLNKR